MRSPGQQTPSLAGRASTPALIVAAWVLAWYVRFDGDTAAGLLRALPRVGRRSRSSSASSSRSSSPSASTTAGGATSRRGTCGAPCAASRSPSIAAFLVFTLLELPPGRRPARDLGRRRAAPAGVRHRLAPARAHAHRAARRPARIVARGKEVIIVGAGDAAQLILREMLRNPALGYTPIGLVDDDPRKKNLRLHGIRVLGTTDELRHLLRDRRPDELLIAIPSASGEVREQIVEIARVGERAGQDAARPPRADHRRLRPRGQIRPVEVEDLLGREPVEVDIDSIADYLTGEVVLVTGAGGSIGAELCRQIARVRPTRLVLVDNGEPGALRDRARAGRRAGIPCDRGRSRRRREQRRRCARSSRSTGRRSSSTRRPTSTSALIEANPLEAVRNNTLVTRTVADVAVEFGAKRFVLVSTDKAVNPKTLMGQSKAICEWIVEAWGTRRHAHALLRRPLRERARLVRERHPDLPQADRPRRAGDRDAPGDDALLHDHPGGRAARDPGRRDRRSRPGLRARHGRAGEDRRPRGDDDPALRERSPSATSAIELIGARPGEKLHEELWSAAESVTPSAHEAISLVTRAPIDAAWLEEELDLLARLVDAGDTLELVGRLNALCGAPRRAHSGDGAGAVETAPASETVS